EVEFTAFSPDGHRIVSAANTDARVWNAQTGQPITSSLQHDERAEGPLSHAAFSPDGRWLVTRGTNEHTIWNQGSLLGSLRVKFWDANTGRPLPPPPPLQKWDFRLVQFSSNGRHVFLVDRAGKSWVWEINNRRPISPLPGAESAFMFPLPALVNNPG